jgi:uncharacterized protein (TIGR02996 family)
MSDEAAFLAAIRANPDDDASRLVYADWLDEQGGASNEARAEYIRLEIQHAIDFPETRWSKEKADAQKPARQLFAKYSREWFPELFGRKNILRGGRAYPQMSRGFPDSLYAEADKLLEVGERVMAVAPITEVEFRDMSNLAVYRFVKAPWVRGIRELNLSGYDVPPTDWTPLADCPHLTEMVELNLCGGRIPPDGAARIAAANHFPKLERFDLGAKAGDAALAKLFGGVAFTGLKELTLSIDRGTFGLKGIEAIARSKALAGLKALDLPWQPIQKVLPALTKAKFWSGLESLEMMRCGLKDKDVAALVRKSPPLRVLNLDDNKITAAGVRTLVESPLLASLTKLDLSRNKIGDKGVAALVNSPSAKNLRTLEVSDCKLGPAGIKALAESPHLANLRELYTYGNNLDLAGARVLAASPHLGGLTTLWVGSGQSASARKVLKARFGAAVIC